jgi:hypothetical protein
MSRLPVVSGRQAVAAFQRAGFEGEKAYGKDRWGDFPGAGIDPSGATVWVAGEYPTGASAWGTYIAEIGF